MTWTYGGDPAASPVAEVRFLIGDTIETSLSLTDKEIEYLLEENDNETWQTAADSANRMAVRFVSMSSTSKKVGDLTLSYDYADTAKRYFALEAKLRRGKGGGTGAPYMADSSPHVFHIGMGDNPASDHHTRRRL